MKVIQLCGIKTGPHTLSTSIDNNIFARANKSGRTKLSSLKSAQKGSLKMSATPPTWYLALVQDEFAKLGSDQEGIERALANAKAMEVNLHSHILSISG